MLLSLDCESTGLDLLHGARPFLVTTCADDGKVRYWEWDVDPLNRRPDIPAQDVADIKSLIDSAYLIYLHNAKFDVRALATIGIELPWSKVRDTLVAAHLLASNHRHDLTWCCIEYLGVDISPYEQTIKEASVAARAFVKRNCPDWRIAGEGAEGMPSVLEGGHRDDDKPWKNDMWLPHTLFFKRVEGTKFPLNWATACRDYANSDSEHTLYFGLETERLIRERGLWSIYEHRLQLPRVACTMEEYGVTARGDYTAATIRQYEEHVAECEAAMHEIAQECGHNLELAQGAALNDNMRDLLYGAVVQECSRCGHRKRVKHWNGERVNDSALCPRCAKGSKRKEPARQVLTTTRRSNLALQPITKRDTGNASLDKAAIQDYLDTLDEGPALDFLRLLADKRGFDTALSYLHAYRRFWIAQPDYALYASGSGYYRIHPSLNPCGTRHLRWASNSPNMQNVSKKEEYNLRSCFGPAPGREWWSMDFHNIELRIPAYESGEPAMVEIFEAGEVTPYWGSYHNLVASIIYAEEYFTEDGFCPRCVGVNSLEKCRDGCLPACRLCEIKDGFKVRYKSSKYQWIKNFNFARIYGCGKRKGDATARKKGACDMVDRGLPKLAALQGYYMREAERKGFVTTLPDRSVDAERGYPILAGQTEDGRLLTTTPFNYHVSGTACWCKNTALIRCAAQCEQWHTEGFDAHIALEIHDEILFDFPRGGTMAENLPRALVLRRLMEQSGKDLIPCVPTPVSVEYHAESWQQGVSVN